MKTILLLSTLILIGCSTPKQKAPEMAPAPPAESAGITDNPIQVIIQKADQ